MPILPFMFYDRVYPEMRECCILDYRDIEGASLRLKVRYQETLPSGQLAELEIQMPSGDIVRQIGYSDVAAAVLLQRTWRHYHLMLATIQDYIEEHPEEVINVP